ncbi:MAG TPA: CDP-alcohol phosphatidyltransferase family protein [Candidatus Saccharimonadales bacterium]|nr:CDP-alcohol phosphatidyltransferase family protein [Candidatus Saccharimonadales bacterium]
MNPTIDLIRQGFKTLQHQAAKWVDGVSEGRITPAAVAVFGLLMHLPIAIMIARGRFIGAATLLFIVGILHSLYGELARLQKSESDTGTLIAAATDRFKEVILYAGAAFFLAGGQNPRVAVWAVLACGAVLSASYIKTKGQAILASHGKKVAYTVTNKMVSGDMFSFEVRMVVLFIGLLTVQLLIAIAGIAVLASIAAMQRLIIAVGKLS